MASVKVKFRPSTVEGGMGSVYFQVIQNRVVRQIGTGYRLYSNEWDDGSSMPAELGEGEARAAEVHGIGEDIRRENALLDNVVASLDSHGPYTADMVVHSYHRQDASLSFSVFMNGVIAKLRKQGRMRTAETYDSALRSFMEFRNQVDVTLDAMNSNLIVHYEAYLKKRGLKKNTISFYMRILRATYNRAVDSGLTSQANPFDNVYTGVDKTVKHALPFGLVKRMKDIDLTSDSSLEFARDMFLFSFYTRGMSFLDMAYLDRDSIQNGVLSYRRRKTGQTLYIKWEPCMQDIVDKYPGAENGRLLPIIKRSNNERRQYESALHLVNHKLKEVGAMIGVTSGLTMYVARHSWASAANSQDIPLGVISEGMGHDSENTTRLYLASLDNSVVDTANGMILHKL